MFLPGPNQFVFQNFQLAPNMMDIVMAKCVEDAVELLPPNTDDYLKVRTRTRAGQALVDLR